MGIEAKNWDQHYSKKSFCFLLSATKYFFFLLCFWYHYALLLLSSNYLHVCYFPFTYLPWCSYFQYLHPLFGGRHFLSQPHCSYLFWPLAFAYYWLIEPTCNFQFWFFLQDLQYIIFLLMNSLILHCLQILPFHFFLFFQILKQSMFLFLHQLLLFVLFFTQLCFLSSFLNLLFFHHLN